MQSATGVILNLDALLMHRRPGAVQRHDSSLMTAVPVPCLSLRTSVCQGLGGQQTGTGFKSTRLGAVHTDREPRAGQTVGRASKPFVLLRLPTITQMSSYRLQDVMEFQAVILLLCLFKTSVPLPV